MSKKSDRKEMMTTIYALIFFLALGVGFYILFQLLPSNPFEGNQFIQDIGDMHSN